MTRRVLRAASGLQAFREARPSIRREFQPGAVLNVLQWVYPNVARFTVEGEGIEVWCCQQRVFDKRTVPPAQ